MAIPALQNFLTSDIALIGDDGSGLSWMFLAQKPPTAASSLPEGAKATLQPSCHV